MTQNLKLILGLQFIALFCSIIALVATVHGDEGPSDNERKKLMHNEAHAMSDDAKDNEGRAHHDPDDETNNNDGTDDEGDYHPKTKHHSEAEIKDGGSNDLTIKVALKYSKYFPGGKYSLIVYDEDEDDHLKIWGKKITLNDQPSSYTIKHIKHIDVGGRAQVCLSSYVHNEGDCDYIKNSPANKPEIARLTVP